MFRSDCLVFLSELTSQMRKRFPFEEDSIIAMLHSMDPKEATNNNRHLKSIIKLALNFASLVSERQRDDLQEEWIAIVWAKETVHPMLS